MKKIQLLLLVCFGGLFATAQEIFLEPYASGFDSPVDLKNAGDDRLFVVEQGGDIEIIQADGSVNATSFLDISGNISSGGERGLLSVAFHPDYSNNGFFFVNYTRQDGGTRISRFSVDPSNPDLALPASELIILEYSQPFSNHNGGCLQFGPDGFLYIASGDGGSGGDPGNRAQNTEVLLGKLLRIDIDNPIPGGTNYSIPADNPFAGNPSSAQEIWAYGLRNPWKFSFDSATDDLWIADVGQNAFEEINKVGATEAGLNYGWRCYEASTIFNNAGCPPAGDLTFPIAEYPHSEGQSITGGYVYRGTDFPAMEGLYFFADFISGLVGSINPSGVYEDYGSLGGNWATFGVDNSNELYIAGFNGVISRVTAPIIFGIDDQDNSTFMVYPNPAEDTVNLKLTNDTISSLTLLDMKGSVLFTEEALSVSQKELNVANLSQGVYLLKLTTQNNSTHIKKLVIE